MQQKNDYSINWVRAGSEYEEITYTAKIAEVVTHMLKIILADEKNTRVSIKYKDVEIASYRVEGNEDKPIELARHLEL